MGKNKTKGKLDKIANAIPTLRLTTFARKLNVEPTNILDLAVQKKIHLYILANDWEFAITKVSKKDFSNFPGVFIDQSNIELYQYSGLVQLFHDDVIYIAEHGNVNTKFFPPAGLLPTEVLNNDPDIFLELDYTESSNFDLNDLIVKLEEFKGFPDLPALIEAAMDISPREEINSTQFANSSICNEIEEEKLGKQKQKNLYKTIGALVLLIQKQRGKRFNLLPNVSAIAKSVDKELRSTAKYFDSDFDEEKEQFPGLSFASLRNSITDGLKAVKKLLPEKYEKY